MSGPLSPCKNCGKRAWGTLCQKCFNEAKPPVEHGTMRSYQRGCKCQPCVTASTTTRRERRKRQGEREREGKPTRTTTIVVTWGESTEKEWAHKFSREVARKLSKLEEVTDARVIVHREAVSGRGQITGPAAGAPESSASRVPQEGQKSRPDRVSTNGDLQVKVPSFKKRGKGRSLIEVVNDLS